MTNNLAKREETSMTAREQGQARFLAQVDNEIGLLAGDDAFRFRIPRLGKLHLGVKVKTANGREYPKATPYFVLPEVCLEDKDFQEVLAKLNADPTKPTTLPVMFPSDDLNDVLWSSCDMYGLSQGLICRADDRTMTTCKRLNPKTAEMESQPCKGEQCADYVKGNCAWIHRIRFMLPDMPGIGVWQIDTKSFNNRDALITELMLVRRQVGKLGGVDLLLRLIPEERRTVMVDKNTKEAKSQKTTVHFLHVNTNFKFRELAAEAEKARKRETFTAEDIEQWDETEPDADAPVVEAEAVEEAPVDAEAQEVPAAAAPPEMATAKDVLEVKDYQRAKFPNNTIAFNELSRNLFGERITPAAMTKAQIEKFKSALKHLAITPPADPMDAPDPGGVPAGEVLNLTAEPAPVACERCAAMIEPTTFGGAPRTVNDLCAISQAEFELDLCGRCISASRNEARKAAK